MIKEKALMKLYEALNFPFNKILSIRILPNKYKILLLKNFCETYYSFSFIQQPKDYTLTKSLIDFIKDLLSPLKFHHI